jgi:hypothetical protein
LTYVWHFKHYVINVHEELSERINERGRGKGKDTGENEEYGSTLYIYDSIMKSAKTLF